MKFFQVILLQILYEIARLSRAKIFDLCRGGRILYCLGTVNPVVDCDFLGVKNQPITRIDEPYVQREGEEREREERAYRGHLCSLMLPMSHVKSISRK